MSTVLGLVRDDVTPFVDSSATDEHVSRVRESWDCGIAATHEQRDAAFQLIYQAYARAGLAAPNEHGRRVTPYQLLPTTTIFTSRLTSGPEAGVVFSTVSLVRDGELGLPLEKVYPNEVAERRAQGLKLAEVSCLADRRSDFRRFLPVFLAINRWMLQFARAQRVDQLLIAVHPKHARFYTKYMGFETMGGLTSYPSVQNRPAVALYCDFAENDRNPFPYYDRYYSESIALSELEPAPMLPAEARYFSRFLESTTAAVCEN